MSIHTLPSAIGGSAELVRILTEQSGPVDGDSAVLRSLVKFPHSSISKLRQVCASPGYDVKLRPVSRRMWTVRDIGEELIERHGVDETFGNIWVRALRGGSRY